MAGQWSFSSIILIWWVRIFWAWSRNRGRKGEVIKALNTTFLVLIPKANKPSTFGDYRPISLCNLCYKIIAKLLANRLRPILSKGLARRTIGIFTWKADPRCSGDGTGMPPQHQTKKSKGFNLKA
jgi:hypothetical protein